ncbi:hypothetical protein B0A55_09215 [Friedmanniomyces simplex]|uniref:Uncharacterized protein n=1 Tax=Friedmanniomyces simplex TaxID=329884 RepID=A0A4U0X2L6_9PEZI|nr:hypothetical protein B0A55_09215 [Friedmanniomyces simplex]
MPNDVYRWEEGGGLVHHCPICKTPLSHDVCRSQCLGQHVEWCSRYHTQLFRKGTVVRLVPVLTACLASKFGDTLVMKTPADSELGWTNQCAPCKHSEAQHDKRHREIAELLHQLKEQQNHSPEPESATPKAVRTNADYHTASPIPKKERKAAKKAAKLASLPKVITTGDIDFVAKTLHPDDHETDQADEERRLLEDPDIKLNLYYHKGTSNTQESRYRHIKRKHGRSDAPEIDEEDMIALLAGLNVPPACQAKTTEERRLIESIRKAVQEDMINVAKEQEQTQMRKAGFWRWASKKVYNRLVQNGRLWDQGADADAPKRKDSAIGEAEDVADKVAKMELEEKDGGAEAVTEVAKLELEDKDGGSGAVEVESAVAVAAKTPTSEGRKSRQFLPKISTAGNGWTQVGKASHTATPKVQLKLSGNGGLAKLMVKPKGMFGALGPNGPGYAGED